MIVVGIDPGIHTGLAVWDTSSRQFLEIRTVGIVAAMEYLSEIRQDRGIGLLVFEDARQRTWIPREKDIRQVKGRAMGAGSVKRDCSIWEDFCKDYGIPYWAKPPVKGATKVSAEYFKMVSHYTGRTSEHSRDAAMLVIGR